MLLYIFCIIAGGGGIIAWLLEVGYVGRPLAVFIWGAGVVLLSYGLLRDVLLLLKKHPPEEQQEIHRMAMICFESTLGVLAVATGLTLQVTGSTPLVSVPLGLVVTGAATIVAFGHATRDWVIVLIKVPNHRNFIPDWRVTSWQQEK